MIKFRVVFLCLLVFTSVVCYAGQEKIQTALGTVEVVQSSPDSSPDTIKIGGKVAYVEEGMYMNLRENFSLPNEEVVFFGVNCGGTGCPNDELHFLILSRGEKPKVISNGEFSSSDGTVKPKMKDGKITVDLGYYDGKRKRAELSADKILIHLTPQPVSPMRLEDCRWLYKYSVDECIGASPDCENPSNAFSNMVMKGVAAFSNHPGFVSKNFDTVCATACNSGKKISFDEYQKIVCSMKVPGTAK